MHPLTRTLLALAALLVVTALAWQLVGRHLPLGRLPGDLAVERGGVRVYVPLVTCLILSLLLTALVNLWRWWGR